MTAGEYETALAQASRLLAFDPAAALAYANRLTARRLDPRAFRLAAAAHRALHRAEEAAEAELEAIKVGFTPELERAVSAREAGRIGDSGAIAEKVLQTETDNLLAKTIAAEAAVQLNQVEHAERLLREVFERAPGFARGAILLANLLSSQARLQDAISIIEELRKQLPVDLTVLRQLASLRAQAGDFAAAAELFGHACALPSGTYHDLVGYAQNLRASGRKAESIATFRRAIEAAPLNGAAWWALAHYFPEEVDEADVVRLRAAVAGSKVAPSDAGLIRIALAIMYDRRGDCEAAFQEISSVRASRQPNPPYDPDSLARHIDALIAGFTPEFFRSRRSGKMDGASLVFIVGMPRSGSTLVERILGRHSRIEAGGEIQVLPRLVAGEAEVGFRSIVPPSLSDRKLDELGETYLDRSREFRRTDKAIFIDKHNANWIHAGLIRLMFPRARIIDVRRDALDCCWSVYKMMFGDAYANDQRHLARYHADYVRFVDAIERAAPGRILTVSYEALVEDIERETRRILRFIGVDFEAGCIDFHLSDQPVATPSSEQVRRPLFRDGIGSAERYRKWLGPLIEELELGARR